ncbi:GAF domain-containing sensor histidine kinase [Conexibacter sp. SYSU D00693]|uniref:sensor histidine kinase n=1 Tax=Conexibacter sp. SYSU D00693 TaxID=2812560 RepID=UPI00196B8A7B|nr:GAF domain-containing sensor histidine kinase [Conexibacter sp. SYSU D00693]
MAAAAPHDLDERMARLVAAIQELACARDPADLHRIVTSAARALAQADGATITLREGDTCLPVAEDAAGPVLGGVRRPIHECIGGWAITHRRPALVADVGTDPRVPPGAFDATFVSSLAMVPIGGEDPIGAIGVFWSERRSPSEAELSMLGALADSAAVALQSLRTLAELELRVVERTRGVQALFEDVTAQAGRLERALEQQARHLRTLAHEVRNPLAAAEGLLGLVVDDVAGLPEQSAEDLRHARAAIAEALRVVGTELEAAKLQGSGTVVAHAEQVDVAELLRSLRGTFRALAVPAGVTLVIEEPVGVPALHTDRHLLAQILRNLLSNALKFTDQGEVRLTTEEVDGAVAFAVCDTGIGISDADRERIFEEFRQVDAAQGGRRAGTGLGLALVNRFATALGGWVELTSEVGRGSTFTVTVPVWGPPA